MDERDLAYLRRAVDLAEHGRGRTHPNPVVGCVLVRDDGVVGEGFHAEFGGAHAEVNALAAAGQRARGATAYVTLEPCDHEGMTGPCTVALRRAGVARVVFGAEDPGPGKGGAQRMRDWGIAVEGPALPRREAWARNAAFFHVHTMGRPYMALKLAMTLDARIARAPGERTAITGPEAAAWVHRVRREFDGILVGRETAVTDDPLLTVRDDAPVERPPARIILDTRLELPPAARLFGDPAPVHVFCGPRPPAARLDALEEIGANVHTVPVAGSGLDLSVVLDTLWAEGVRAVLCEGGGRLASSLLSSGLVQRLYLLLAPRILGKEGVPAFPGSSTVLRAADWTPSSPPETFGADVLVTWDKEEAVG